MYKKKNKNSKFYYIGIGILLAALITISLLTQRGGNHKNNVLKTISSAVEKVVMMPFTSLNQEKGKTQDESYLIQKNINSSLEKEIQELKEELELNKTLTEYEPVNATILSRNKSYWFNTLTIDKGTSSGISENMAVITKNGLIGKISKTYKNSSEIKLITSDDINFKVSVSIKTNEIDNYAIMSGYDKRTGCVIASGIDKTTAINKGDAVLTSGLGEMFPAGIYIGEVEDIKNDKYNLSKTVYIKTKQNFNDVHYVTVLKVKK